MAFRQGPFGDVKVPLTWTAGAALAVAAVIATAVVFVGRQQTDQSDPVHQAVDVVARPVNGALATPVRWGGSLVDNFKTYFFVMGQNRDLRRQVAELQQWKDVALSERDVNERYRALLGMHTDPPLPTASALLVADARGPFANTRLADAGVEKGVAVGNPVMSPRGLVGRVVGVADRASRVLLLTDVVSQMPVMLDRTNGRAILVGDGGSNPRLDFLRSSDPPRPGDRIVTSGDGGVVPRGLPVGAAVKGLDGRWRVKLYSDAEPIDYVQILLFKDFSQLVDQKALAAIQMPPVITEDPEARMIANPNAAAIIGAPAAAARAAALTPSAAGPAAAPAATPARSAATAVSPPTPPAPRPPAGATGPAAGGR